MCDSTIISHNNQDINNNSGKNDNEVKSNITTIEREEMENILSSPLSSSSSVEPTTTKGTRKMPHILSHTLLPNNNNNSNNTITLGDRLIGGCIITFIFACLFIGPMIPLVLIWLFIFGYYQVVITSAIVVVSSMFLLSNDHSPMFCRLLLQCSGYFLKGVTLHIERNAISTAVQANKNEDQNGTGSMWCMHPHGTSIGYGFILNGAMRFRTNHESKYVHPDSLHFGMSQERLRNAHGVQAPILFKLPLIRNLMMLSGCSTPATKENLYALFQKNCDFGMLPGGMDEVALYKKGHERIYIQNRKGFIKYALQYGYQLIPCYTFGESDLYNSFNSIDHGFIGRCNQSMQLYTLKHFGFVIPLFWGPYAKYGLPWLPRNNIPINTVVGNTLQLPKIIHPTDDDIIKYHKLYMRHITDLFNSYKTQFGYGDRQLEIL